MSGTGDREITPEAVERAMRALNCTKIAYPTRLDARRALLSCWKKGQRNPERQEMRIYQCKDCGQFHLTSSTHGSILFV